MGLQKISFFNQTGTRTCDISEGNGSKTMFGLTMIECRSLAFQLTESNGYTHPFTGFSERNVDETGLTINPKGTSKITAL